MTLPSSWSTKTIGDLFDIGAGKTVNAEARTTDPKHPFLRTANVLWGRLDLAEVDRMHFTTDDLVAKTLRPGDLLVCEGGDIGRAAIWNGDIPRCGFQNHLHRLRPKRAGVVPAFFMYALQAGFTLHARYEGAGNKTTIPNLSRSRLEALEVPEPPPADQARIAAVLALVQRALETEEKVIATTRELKRSAMEKVFTVGLRGGVSRGAVGGLTPDAWETERLDACCNVVSSSMSYTELAAAPDAGGADAVEVMGIKVSDMNLLGNEIEILSANLSRRMPPSEAHRRAVPPGAVIFPKRGAAIATNKKRVATAWTILDPNLIAVEAGERIDARFLYQWFQRFDLRTITEPGPTPQLNKKNLVPLLIPHPSTREEQAEIAGLLDCIDRAVTAHERKRATLEALFATLLDKLMTAEIGIDKLDIDVSGVTTS